ncbi:MAG: outer membrane beta-barrel family protein, partial [Muribaculaceae bacterium]|nr:outer membrane beta-barrel family protein [Muribaculaceae bacterium]
MSLVVSLQSSVFAGRFAAVNDSVTKNNSTTQRVDTLAEFVVTESNIRHEGLNDTYIVTKAMRENTHSAGELLGKIEGIFYNPISTELSYLGSKKVMILVDSLEKDDSYIKRLNPNRFSKINIVSLPGGKYADYDVVVNLVTKKTYQGYDGTLLAEANLRTGNRNGEGHPFSSLRDIVEMTYTRQKFNFALSASYNGIDNGERSSFISTYPLNSYSISSPMPDQDKPNRFVRNHNGSVKLWADYRFNSSHSISVGVALSPSKERQFSDYPIFTGYSSDRTYQGVQHTSTEVNGYLSSRLSLQYRGRVKSWMLDATAGFSNTSYNYDYYLSRPGFETSQERKNKATYGWAGMDASRRMADSKLYLSLSDHATWIGFYEKDRKREELLTKSRDFRNRLEAILQYTPSRKWSFGIKVGMGVEHSRRGDISATHFTPRFNANVNFSSSPFWARLNYTVTGANPTLTQTRDYGSFTDSLVFTSGNPLLSPVVGHKVNLNVGLPFNLTLGAEYNLRHNALFNIASTENGVRPDGLIGPFVEWKFMNGRGDKWRANISWNKTLSKRWTISISASVNGERAEFKGTSNSTVRPEYDWFVQYFSQKAALQVYLSSALHSFLTVTPQEYGWGQHDGYALSVVKFLFANRLQLIGMWPLPV